MLQKGAKIDINESVTVHHHQRIAFHRGKGIRDSAAGSQRLRLDHRNDFNRKRAMQAQMIQYCVRPVTQSQHHTPDSSARDRLQEVIEERRATHGRKHLGETIQTVTQPGSKPAGQHYQVQIADLHGTLSPRRDGVVEQLPPQPRLCHFMNVLHGFGSKSRLGRLQIGVAFKVPVKRVIAESQHLLRR